MDILLQKIQDGDEKGFKEFYDLQFFKLYQFAYSFVHSREISEEIVNDVFLNLWLKKDRLSTINNIQVYLYISIKNGCLNYLRKNNLSLPVSIDDLSVDHFPMVPDPEFLLSQRELQQQIREAIEQLPSRCRLIFKMVKEDGLSYKEVAAILEISIKTVDSQLCLALKKLAAILQPINI
ncbi:MAG TPA: RNA polymerase sigma-70 factor [Flavisolibacter sp.]|jgi:RNA polymerase sigma-70 factor (ECF subfamily)|nr:RNA polymerase sigma-70 factor [Flavisolibacter sp.]